MRLSLVVGGIVLLVVAAIVVPCLLDAGEVSPSSGYALLEPIHSGNLTVFPVVAGKSFETGQFLTLDEGIRSGEVVVTEAGQAQGLIRRRPGLHPTPQPGGQRRSQSTRTHQQFQRRSSCSPVRLSPAASRIGSSAKTASCLPRAILWT